MIWNNPIFIRYCRSELRLKRAAFWYLLTFMVTAFTVAVIYSPMVIRGVDAQTAARAALFPLMVIQGIILLFLGTGNVASGMVREKVEDVFNYQRLTPLPVRDKIIGYLFGLPVREYVMFAITLPFLAFIIIAGKVPASAWIPFYAVFLCSALLYHLTGLFAGMIGKWRWSGRLAQWMIVVLYFVLPQFSHLGLLVFEYLTVRPTFREKILPLVQGSMPGNDGAAAIAGVAQSVPFFHLSLSGTLFSFLIQGALIALFARMIARKWAGESTPAVGKPLALVTLGSFGILALGNLWTMLRVESAPLPMLHPGSPEAMKAALAVIPLVLAGTLTLLAILLMISAVPGPIAQRMGQLRARRQERARLNWWEDHASGYRLTGLLIVVIAAFIGVAFHQLYNASAFHIAGTPVQAAAVLPITVALLLVYVQGIKEQLGGRPLSIFVLLHGFGPLLCAILVGVSNNDAAELALLVAGLSPIALLPLSATLLAEHAAAANELAAAHRALGAGMLTLFLANLWLHLRARRVRQSVLD
jgi:hypothetical protein